MLPIDAVVFDFHTTLVDQGDTTAWLSEAERAIGRPADPDGQPAMVAFLDALWDRAHTIDPQALRDHSPADHRRLYDILMTEAPYQDPDLAEALYVTVSDHWRAYDDAAGCLTSLRGLGVRTVVLSNTGIDIVPVVAREGLLPLVDGVVQSFQIGTVKPQPAAFRAALDAVNTTPDRALMVGDNLTADGGAALLGIRSLILPRTPGMVHGLDAVVGLVAATRD